NSATRTFRVEPPRSSAAVSVWQHSLRFHRDRYGPGEEIQADFLLQQANATPLADVSVRATLTVDGRDLPPVTTRTTATGQARLRFILPMVLRADEAHLSVSWTDQGQVQTIRQAIPLRLQQVQMEFFPEGGELVVGLPSRVYFQARTLAGQPIEVRGTLFENGKPTNVHLMTWSEAELPASTQGRGLFAFTPKPETRYSVRLDRPEGLATEYPLPTPRSQGVTLRVEGGVFAASDPIRVQLHSDRPRTLFVGLYGHEGLLDSQTLPAGQTDVILRPSRTDSQGGVCRVAVFEAQTVPPIQRGLAPLAERLVYRQPAKRLQVQFQPQQRSYRPGERVQVQIQARDENNQPIAAIAQVSAIAKPLALAGGVFTRRQAEPTPSLPTFFLLGSEVQRPEDLCQADILLGSQPQAAAALDLLLGTQNPRRLLEPEERADQPSDSRLPADQRDHSPLLSQQTVRELSTLSQQSAEVVGRYLQRGLSLLNTLQQQRQERLQQWYAAQAEAQEAAQRSFTRWQQLRNISALTAGLLALLCTLMALAVPSRGPWLVLGFTLSVMAVILVSLVPMTPPSVSADQEEQVRSLLETTEWQLWELLERWQEDEKEHLLPARPEAITPHRPKQAPTSPATGYPLETGKSNQTEGSRGVGDAAALRLLEAQTDANQATTTLSWHPVVQLPQGEATVSFLVPEASVGLHVTAYVHTLDGRLAAATTTITPVGPEPGKPK
ncbi:MAG: hypothetical protein SNJ75_08700, partial [Gemmataceae bacterium]